MKKIAIYLVLALLGAQTAEACVKVSSDYSICPNDAVFKSGIGGKVVGVNPFTFQVTYLVDTYSSYYLTADADTVSIGRGCLLNYCVGNKVVSSGVAGRIVGINPFENTITFLVDTYSSYYLTKNIQDVAIAGACLKGYCEGDVVVKGGVAGKIVAVNPFTKQISYLVDTYSSYYLTASMRDVSLGYGCIYGYCVGDRVMASGVAGQIAAINPYENTVTFLVDTYSSYYLTKPLQDVSISTLCLEFSVDHPLRLVEKAEDLFKFRGSRTGYTQYDADPVLNRRTLERRH